MKDLKNIKNGGNMQVVRLKLITDKKFEFKDVKKFRGFMGRFLEDEILFHNHIDKNRFLYNSSKIQYKIIDGYFTILGIGEGAELLEKYKDYFKFVKIEDETIKITGIECHKEETELEIVDEMISYEFISEWYALNSENYQRYKSGEVTLNKQLQNNMIELFKMCGIWADKPIEARGVFKEKVTYEKEIKILTFTGSFVTNVKIPDYIGLGKRKSVGYGVIKKI